MEQDKTRITDTRKKNQLNLFYKITCVILGLLVIGILSFDSAWDKVQKENRELKIQNQRLTERVSELEASIPKHQPSLERKSEDKVARPKAPKPLERVEGAVEKFSPVFHYGEFDPTKLPSIRELLSNLKAARICATFIFEVGSTTREPKLFRQLRRHCHEVGFSKTAPSWAANSTAPILAPAGVTAITTTQNQPQIHYAKWVDMARSGETSQMLVSASPGEIIGIDPSRDPRLVRIFFKSLTKLQGRNPPLHPVSVSALMTAASRREPAHRAELVLHRQRM